MAYLENSVSVRSIKGTLQDHAAHVPLLTEKAALDVYTRLRTIVYELIQPSFNTPDMYTNPSLQLPENPALELCLTRCVYQHHKEICNED